MHESENAGCLVLIETLHFFFKNSNYIALLSKTAFKTDFGPREVPQSESESAGFLVTGTSGGPKSFWKAVSLKSAI